MTFTDETLVCRDCQQEFVFTAGEQEFFASRNLTNKPGRCPSCRAERKSRGNFSSNRSAPREARQMYTATCSNCGNEAQVPFRPRGDKPVYCSDCFQGQSADRSSGSSYERRARW